MRFRFAQDRWISQCLCYDKVYHFVGGAFLFSLFSHWFENLTSFIITAILGWIWEVKDGFGKKADGFSWRDAVAVIVGAFCVWVIL